MPTATRCSWPCLSSSDKCDLALQNCLTYSKPYQAQARLTCGGGSSSASASEVTSESPPPSPSDCEHMQGGCCRGRRMTCTSRLSCDGLHTNFVGACTSIEGCQQGCCRAASPRAHGSCGWRRASGCSCAWGGEHGRQRCGLPSCPEWCGPGGWMSSPAAPRRGDASDAAGPGAAWEPVANEVNLGSRSVVHDI